MINIKEVTKIYSPSTGNFNISLSVKDGEVYSIVGPNGSGKTTFIRQILGFIKSDSGQIDINGINPWQESAKLMQFTGYVPGEVNLYDSFSGIEYLKMVSKFKKNIDFVFIDNLIKHFNIDVNTKIKKMSKGMKQKIAIIAAILHKPKFLVLDEPTSGLDPVMQEQFITIIKFLKKELNITVIICSHILSEVISLSDRVGFLKDGLLVDEMKVDVSDLDLLRKKFKDLYNKEKTFNV